MAENTRIFSLLNRLRRRLESRKIKNSEAGLALLDVLIGVALFGLLAIIAVTAVSQYRARAYEAGVVSDARQLGIAYELMKTDMDGYIWGPMAVANEQGVNFTQGNLVNQDERGRQTYFLHEDNRSAVAFCVEHPAGAYAFWDSEAGGIVAKGRSGGCEAAGYEPGWAWDTTTFYGG